jgi:hypothetical protein
MKSTLIILSWITIGLGVLMTLGGFSEHNATAIIGGIVWGAEGAAALLYVKEVSDKERKDENSILRQEIIKEVRATLKDKP